MNNTRPTAFSTLLTAWLVAGTLDGLSAIVFFGPVLGRLTVTQLFQYIASAVQGKQAFAGGAAAAWLGVLLHYSVALIFTVLYFLLFPSIRAFARHKVLAGLCYGIVVWVIMNFCVLPLTQVNRAPMRVAGSVKDMLILMVMIGLPISLIVYRYYRRRHLPGLEKTL
jgi:hypothetical protein